MAQHIPINQLKQKVFKRISTGIRNAFREYTCMKSSLRYIYSEDLSRQYHDKYIEVYITERYIGPGYIHGSNRGLFEIHYNVDKKRVTDIFLVA